MEFWEKPLTFDIIFFQVISQMNENRCLFGFPSSRNSHFFMQHKSCYTLINFYFIIGKNCYSQILKSGRNYLINLRYSKYQNKVSIQFYKIQTRNHFCSSFLLKYFKPNLLKCWIQHKKINENVKLRYLLNVLVSMMMDAELDWRSISVFQPEGEVYPLSWGTKLQGLKSQFYSSCP